MAKAMEPSADDAPLIFSAAEDYSQGIVTWWPAACVRLRPAVHRRVPRGWQGARVCPLTRMVQRQSSPELRDPARQVRGMQAAGFSCPTAVVPEVERHLKDLPEPATERDPRPTLEVDAETPLVTAGQPIWEQPRRWNPPVVATPGRSSSAAG